jgi:hypothetical protein
MLNKTGSDIVWKFVKLFVVKDSFLILIRICFEY